MLKINIANKDNYLKIKYLYLGNKNKYLYNEFIKIFMCIFRRAFMLVFSFLNYGK